MKHAAFEREFTVPGTGHLLYRVGFYWEGEDVLSASSKISATMSQTPTTADLRVLERSTFHAHTSSHRGSVPHSDGGVGEAVPESPYSVGG